MEFKEPKFERREDMPFEADLRVDFIRHGEPVYSKEEIKEAKIEGTLTSASKERLKKQIKELAAGIDKEKELIVIWSSPKRRARQTAEIAQDVFEEEKVPIVGKGRSKEYKLRIKKSLRDADITSEFEEEIIGKMQNGESPAVMEYWAKTSKLPEGVETPEEVKQRVIRTVAYLEKIARTIRPIGGKKLHFIISTHGDITRDLLEEAYGLGTAQKTMPAYGEVVRMDIHKSESGKDAVLDMFYRGKKARLGFDKDERKFYSQNNAE